MTFSPDTMRTKAVWYGAKLYKHDVHGYSLSEQDIISGRLSGFDGGAFHPMLLPTIFADFERDRQIPLARECFTNLIAKLSKIPDSHTISLRREKQSSSSGPSLQHSPTTSGQRGLIRKTIRPDKCCPSNAATSPLSGPLEKSSEPERASGKGHFDRPIDHWIAMSAIRNGLEDWRAQLVKMIDHTDDFERQYLTRDSSAFLDGLGSEDVVALIRVGQRIKVRLRDLTHEYDEALRNCVTSMEGMSLAMQLVRMIQDPPLSRNSLPIAHSYIGAYQHQPQRCIDQPWNLLVKFRRGR